MCDYCENGRLISPIVSDAEIGILVPVGITGADRIKPHDQKGLHFPKITVSFGQAIDLGAYRELPKAERVTRLDDYCSKAVRHDAD